MSGSTVIRLQVNRRARWAVAGNSATAMLVSVIVEGMMFTGVVIAFILTRASAGTAWPPAGQPWFPLEETTINSAALLASGALVLRAARVWRNPQARIGPLLIAAIALGAFFLFFQGLGWVMVVGEGLALTSNHHGVFFCLIVGLHAANTLGALIFLSAVWLRLKPLRDDGDPRGSLTSSTFLAARILWYFVVGIWPILYLCHFL